MRLGVKVRSMGDGLTAPENGAVAAPARKPAPALAAPGAFGFPVALGRQALRLLNSGRGGIVMLLVNLDADAWRPSGPRRDQGRAGTGKGVKHDEAVANFWYSSAR